MEQISEGERIVKLMLFIRENGPVTLEAIRRQFPNEYGEPAGSRQSTRRRFERDKKTLQDFGIYLAIDDQQRYALDMEKSYAAPLSLTSSQVSLLRLLCGALLEDEGYPFKEDLRMVLVKLGEELDIPDMLPQLEDSAGAIGRSSEPQGFSKIRKAISSRKRLSFGYSNSSGTCSTREVEPFGCFFLRGACYVVAYDPSAEGIRCFRADRMSKIRVNAASPNSPDFEERAFDAADYYGLPFQFGSDELVARVRIDAQMAPELRRSAMGQGDFEQVDDQVIWTVTCRDCTELARWCVENAPGAQILEPANATRIVEEGARTFLQRLNESTGEGA